MITNSRISASLEARDGSTLTLQETLSESFGTSSYPLATVPIKETIVPLQSYTTALPAVNQGRLFLLKTNNPVYVTYVGNPPEVATTLPLATGVNETDVTFNFATTSPFPYTGAAAMGNEIFTWASKTATTLGGIARGAFGTTAVSHAASGIGVATNLPVTKMYTTKGFLASTYISHVIVENPASGTSPDNDCMIEMAAVGV